MSKKTKITVSTKPNGYVLTVEGEEFMYFSEIDLMAGFIAHVGMQNTDEMEKSSILHSIFSAMLGSEYADAVTTLKKRVGMLTEQYETTISRMDTAIDYVTNAEKQIEGMQRRVASLSDGIAGTATEYAKVRKELDESVKKWNNMEKMSNRVLDNLTKATTAADKKKGKESNARPDNSKTTDKADDTPSGNKKPGGGRKKNDQKILEQLAKDGQIKLD